MDFDDFKKMYSDLIMYCQVIENDVKLIYSYIKDGDANDNYQWIATKTLGHSIKLLKDLDYSDNDRLITPEQYNFLLQMSEKRNYWAHENFLEFMYEPNLIESTVYKNQCKRLIRDTQKLRKVYGNLEQFRIKISLDYNK